MPFKIFVSSAGPRPFDCTQPTVSVSKRLDKPYSSGRCHHWRKVKNSSYVRS
jgi:hypothetical protein